jgi:alpha-1,3-rhamnosyl/mannosyltransferase
MTRVALSTTLLQGPPGHLRLDGIGRYTEELQRTLGEIPGLAVVPCAFRRRTPAESAPGMLELGPFRFQALATLAAGCPFPIASANLAGRADIFHATDHFIPKLRRLPVVATLHDAIPLSHPEWINYSLKHLKNALWRRSARWADRVVTVSEHSKMEITRWFGITPDRISVTPLGVHARWFETLPPEELNRVRAAHQLPNRFILFVGTLQPRKNVGGLISAHRLLPSTLRRETPLVVAGRAGWLCQEEVGALQAGDGGSLRFLDHVPEHDLQALFQLATAFVLPSHHEGFGLPVLEAFASGVPVVATTAGSIPEVAGHDALLVSPTDHPAMADAIRFCLDRPDAVREMTGRARLRAADFTWERTARLTADAYREALRTSNGAP